MVCKQLNKDFTDKAAMFEALKANEKAIIELKKAAVFKSFEKGQFSPLSGVIKLDQATKAGIDLEEGYIYPVINTTKYMDAHDDVHFDGIWNKTLKEQQGNIYYLSDHTMKLDSVIAFPESVEAFTKELDWSVLGRDYAGKTQALIYKIAKDNIVSESARAAIEAKRPLQNSVRMQYIKIRLALDSEAKEHKDNKQYFDERIEGIANKEQVKEQGYFYGVEEAKIYKEGSLVLFGSNDVTPIMIAEPSTKGTQHKEPPESTLTIDDFRNELKNLFK